MVFFPHISIDISSKSHVFVSTQERSHADKPPLVQSPILEAKHTKQQEEMTAATPQQQEASSVEIDMNEILKVQLGGDNTVLIGNGGYGRGAFL